MPKTINGAEDIAAGPIAESILALPEHEVPAFFRRQIAERQLSVTVRILNSDMLSKEQVRIERARRALARLGLDFRA